MADDAKVLGYGGSGVIDGVQVLMTSGNIDIEQSVSYLDFLNLPPPQGSQGAVTRSRVKHADGVVSFTGSISFDLTADLLNIFTTAKMFNRGYKYAVTVFTGEEGQYLANCYTTSLSISGSPGGLIAGSLSFVSDTIPFRVYIGPSGEPRGPGHIIIPASFIRDTDSPLGYWYSGNTDVRDWTLNLNQAVTPVYINDPSGTQFPRYLKVGLWDLSLEVVTYEAVREHAAISIVSDTFTITGNSAGQGFNFNGPADLGTFRHVFESAADIAVGSQDPIIAIT